MAPSATFTFAHVHESDAQLVAQAESAARPLRPYGRRDPAARVRKAEVTDFYSRAPEGRHFPDDPKPSDHLLFLHGGPGSGRRSVCLRRLQKPELQLKVDGLFNSPSAKMSMARLLEHVDALADEPNLFLAQADYFWGARGDKNRRRSNANYLNSIGTVFVDLDVYNVDRWSGVDTPSLCDAILATCAQAGVPAPLIISSGRGLYANWKLAERVDLRKPGQRARWEQLQRRLMALLTEFGPDSKVRDATRILRLVGTINSRSRTRVTVAYDDGQSYSLEYLEACAEHLSDTLYAAAADKDDQKRPAPDLKDKIKRGKTSKDASATGNNTLPSTGVKDSDEPLSDPAALEHLAQMLEQDKAVIPKLTRTRAYQYRLFADIAKVIQMRGGVARGARDEFIFWLLVMRYNAGVYDQSELEVLAAQFAGLTQGGLNLWEAGMLSTLHARMTSQSDAHGTAPVRAPTVIRKHAAFSVVRYTSRPKRSHDAAPLGFGDNYARPLVYTPKASTLVERLGITPYEQAQLDYLISPSERLRRKRAASAATQRKRRNDRLINAVIRSDKPISHWAKSNRVSAATAYRVLAQSQTLQAQRTQRAQERQQQKNRLQALWQATPAATVRALAQEAGVAISTAHRWITAWRLEQDHARAAQASRLAHERSVRVDQTLRDIAIQYSPKRHSRLSKTNLFCADIQRSHHIKITGKSALSHSPARGNPPVPVSHLDAHSNKGIGLSGDRLDGDGDRLDGDGTRIDGECLELNLIVKKSNQSPDDGDTANVQGGSLPSGQLSSGDVPDVGPVKHSYPGKAPVVHRRFDFVAFYQRQERSTPTGPGAQAGNAPHNQDRCLAQEAIAAAQRLKQAQAKAHQAGRRSFDFGSAYLSKGIPGITGIETDLLDAKATVEIRQSLVGSSEEDNPFI